MASTNFTVSLPVWTDSDIKRLAVEIEDELDVTLEHVILNRDGGFTIEKWYAPSHITAEKVREFIGKFEKTL